jgi:TP901 family phage tail tape measure protein
MSDIQSNIGINIDASGALGSLRALQREISLFHSSMAKGGAAANAQSAQMQQNLINTINAGGKFSATIRSISTTTESFTNALEKNKLSMGEYFRFAGGASNKFGRFFKSEMDTVGKVARERVKDLQTQYIKLGRDANGAMKSIAVRPLVLDMDSLATKTAIAAQKQQLFNQLMKQGSTNLLNFGKNTQWAGRQLMVGFTIPLSIFGTMAARTFMNLQKETIAFRKVYGDMLTTDVEADKALADIKELASELAKYGASINDTINLAGTAAAAGFSGEALFSQTREATRLSVLGQLDGQKSLETTIALQNAFRISTEELGDSINFLNAVENQTVVSLEDITTAIPRVAPVVQALGGDLKDLAFFMAAMKESGIQASQGANALRSGLASLINPSDKAAKVLGDMGINIRGIVENSGGDLRTTVIGFAQALDKLDPLTRARAIEQLFGKFQFARVSALFDNVIRDGSQAQRVADLAATSIEDLGRLADDELGVVAEAATTKFNAALEQLRLNVAPIGEDFLKMVTPIIEFATGVLKAFNNLDEGTRKFVVGTIGVLGGIAPVAIMTFGLLANGVANAIKFFLVLRNIFLKTTQSSTTLGQQVDYMTKEQLEAATVAASLGQTHSRLTQIFTAEAHALRQLAGAYGGAVNAQRMFNGPVMPGGVAGTAKKYNKGVVMVPGAGSRDTQPAMLTPGEAVIPAPMAEKYAPLISAMINGEIPGYNAGRFSSQSSSFSSASIPIFGEFQLRLQDAGQNRKQLASTLESAVQVLAPLSVRVGEARGIAPSINQAKSGSFDDIAEEYRPLVENFVEKLNGHFEQTYASIESSTLRFEKAWMQAGKELESEVNQVSSETDKSVIRKVFGLEDDFLGTIPTQPRERGSAQMPSSARRSAFLRSSGAPSSYRGISAATSIVSERLGFDPSGQQLGHVSSQTQKILVEELLAKDGISAAVRTAAKQVAKSLMAWIEDGAIEGIKSSTRQASPSKEARRAGENIGVGAIQGLESQTDEAQDAGRKLGRRVSTGVISGDRLSQTDAVVGNPRTNRRAGTSGPISTGGPGAFSTIPPGYLEDRAAKNAAAAEQRQQTAQAAREESVRLENLSRERSAQSAQRMSSAISGVSYGLTAVSGVLAMFGGGAAELSQQIFKITSVISGLMFAMQSLSSITGKNVLAQVITNRTEAIKAAVLNNATLAQRANTTATNVNTAAKTLNTTATRSIVGGFSNLAVGVAGFGRGLAAAGRIAMAAIGGIPGIIFAIVGGLALVLFPMLSDAINESIRRQRGLSDAALLADEKLSALAELFGKTAKANPFGEGAFVGSTPEQAEKVRGLLSSDQFEEDFKNEIASFKNASEAQLSQLASLVANQLRSMTDMTEEEISLAIRAMAIKAGKSLDDSYTQTSALDVVRSTAQQAAITAEPLTRFDVAVGQVQANRPAPELGYFDDLTPTDYDSISTATSSQPGELDPEERARIAGELAAQVKFLADAAGNAIVSMQAQFDSGVISIDEYNDGMRQVSDAIALLDSESQSLAMSSLIENIAGDDKEFASAINGLSSVEDQLLAIQAVGVAGKVAVADIMSKLGSSDSAVVDEGRTQLNSLIAESIRLRAEEVAKKQEGLEVDARAVEIDSYLEGADAKLEAMNNEIEAFDYLIALGWDEVDALNAIADAEFNSALVAAIAAEKNGEVARSVEDVIGSMQELLRLGGRETTVGAARERRSPSGRTGGGSGGGSAASQVQASMLDGIVKRINSVVSGQTRMTKGWVDSRNALDRMAGSGNPLNGLEQQMRKLGANQNLIELIAGMDAEEFEKRKNELFTFDSAGNITAFRGSLVALGQALNRVALGEFQSKAQSTVKTFSNQRIAIQKLIKAGVSLAQAYEMVQDAAVAAAIANENNSSTIRQIAKDAREATEALENLAAAQAVATSNQEVVDQTALVKKLESDLAAGRINNAQVQAILSDTNLQRLYLNPEIDPKSLQNALKNANNAAKLELRIKKLTIEGMEEIFQDGFSKAMEAFDVKTEAIEIEFRAKKKPFEDIIKRGRELISDITNRAGGLDDLEADLQRIQFQEEDINKKYDEREKALQRIRELNDQVTARQRAQLGVADALSRGDIAAAARAAQEKRQEQVKQAIDNQQKVLELSRERELAALTGQLGMTREQIETAVRNLKQQILEIEESMIEPAEYQVELLEREEKLQISSLKVLGMTRDEWEKVKNKVDLARVNSNSYRNAINDALDVVRDILKYWTDLDGKKVTTTHTIVTKHETKGSPAPAPSVPPASSDSGRESGTVDRPSSKPSPGSTSTGPAGWEAVPKAIRDKWDSFANKYAMKNGTEYRQGLTKRNDLLGSPTNRALQNALADYLKKYGFGVPGYGTTTSSGGGTPNRFMNVGGLARSVYGSVMSNMTMGSDRVPTMLQPGEFVVSKYGVSKTSPAVLKSINNGTFGGGSVYNYSITVNAKTNANADEIASSVMNTIRSIDAKRIRGSRIG